MSELMEAIARLEHDASLEIHRDDAFAKDILTVCAAARKGMELEAENARLNTPLRKYYEGYTSTEQNLPSGKNLGGMGAEVQMARDVTDTPESPFHKPQADAGEMVKDLRLYASPLAEHMADGGRLTHLCCLARDAASLIERQAADIERLRKGYEPVKAALEAEIERLREVLEQIAGPESDGYVYHGSVYQQQIARAATTGEKEDG